MNLFLKFDFLSVILGYINFLKFYQILTYYSSSKDLSILNRLIIVALHLFYLGFYFSLIYFYSKLKYSINKSTISQILENAHITIRLPTGNFHFQAYGSAFDALLNLILQLLNIDIFLFLKCVKCIDDLSAIIL